jgi:chaperonin GroEL
MPKNVLFEDGRRKALNGIRKMVDAVGCTMGPDGKTMLIDKGRFNRPIASRDGVTVAKHVVLEDPEEALGASIVYEAASRTNDHAGDATTCATVLAGAMIEEGVKHAVAGRNVNKLRRGMLLASAKVVEELKKYTKEIESAEEIAQIGAISSQDTEIGALIANVMADIGEDGTITVDIKQSSPGMEYNVLEGMQIDRGYSSPLFSTDGRKMEYNMEGVSILISSDPIMRQQQLVPIIDSAVKTGRKNILIIAPHLDAGHMGSPMQFLLKNKIESRIVPVFVKAPEHGERLFQLLEDIAVYTNTKLYSSEFGMPLPEGLTCMEKVKQADGTVIERMRKDCDVSNLGYADRVIVDGERTSIVGGRADEKRKKERIAEIKATIETSSDNFSKEFNRERLGNLTSGVGVISVAASTEFESEELRLRVDDALASVRSAVHEGILPGGGVAMLRCIDAVRTLEDGQDDDDMRMGVQIVRKACEKPAWQIATVSGEKGDWIVGKILEEKKNPNYGFDSSSKKWGDMLKMGIIDPKRAIRSAMENAVSVAATYLTMHGTITDIPGKDDMPPPQPRRR